MAENSNPSSNIPDRYNPADSFKFEEVKGIDNDPNSVATIKPTVDDGRLTAVEVMFKRECKGEKNWGPGCQETKLIFKVDPKSNPCQFESINLEERQKNGIERRPLMAKMVCQAIQDYRKKSPSEDFTNFDLSYRDGNNSTWKEKFGLIYSLSSPVGSEHRLRTLEKQCQIYSPTAVLAAAPATAAGQGAVVPKAQPAAK